MVPPGSGNEPPTLQRSLAVGTPDSTAARNLLHRSLTDDRGRLLGRDVALRIGVIIAALDEQPLGAARPAQPGEHEATLQSLSVHDDAELALLVATPQRFGTPAVVGFIASAIPQHHRSSPVLTLRNRP